MSRSMSIGFRLTKLGQRYDNDNDNDYDYDYDYDYDNDNDNDNDNDAKNIP